MILASSVSSQISACDFPTPRLVELCLFVSAGRGAGLTVAGTFGFDVELWRLKLPRLGCLSTEDGVRAGFTVLVGNSGFDAPLPSLKLPPSCLSKDDELLLNDDGAGGKDFSGFLVSAAAVIGTLLSGFSITSVISPDREYLVSSSLPNN